MISLMNSGGTAMFDQDEEKRKLLAKSIFALAGDNYIFSIELFY